MEKVNKIDFEINNYAISLLLIIIISGIKYIITVFTR